MNMIKSEANEKMTKPKQKLFKCKQTWIWDMMNQTTN